MTFQGVIFSQILTKKIIVLWHVLREKSVLWRVSESNVLKVLEKMRYAYMKGRPPIGENKTLS